MAARVYPVRFTYAVVVSDPDTGEELTRVEVTYPAAAVLQEINVALDAAGFAPMFVNAETRQWATTDAGARRL